MKKILHIFIVLILSSGSTLLSQERFRVSGEVRCTGSKECLLMTPVQIKELGIYSVTDMDGKFVFENVPAGTYTFFITSLGFQPLEQKITINKSVSDLTLYLNPQSLNLESVEVIATRGGGINSSSVINQQAIEHIQPTSVKDILQLMPGSVTENPNLNARNLLTIRGIGSTADGGTSTATQLNALGTSLILDGATISNDANMQVSSNFNAESEFSTAGTGVDARTLSTDNIESIEVIRGIPSAEYGDLTSGAVIVKSKSGQSPLEVRFKTDPKIKHIYAGKGIKLSSGIINVGADFSRSQKEMYTPRNAYNRTSVQLGYSNTFFKKLSFNARINAYHSLSELKSDPDFDTRDYTKDLQQNVRLNINGTLRIQKPWLTLIDYMVSGSIGKQYNETRGSTSERSSFNRATTSGIAEGFFTPTFYEHWLKIDGEPVNLQSKITAKLIDNYGKINNKALLGFEFSSSGNNGNGKTFDLNYPPNPSATSLLRQRSYKEIPYLNRLTFFAEDKVAIPLNGMTWEIQAGMRFNAILPNEKFVMEDLTSFEPRLNTRLILVENQNLVKHWSIRGGWGLNYKMPVMSYLFPEPYFFDRRVFSYDDFANNGFSMALYDVTRVDDNVNPKLKIPRSENIELATEFTIGGVSGSITYFNEKVTNGYSVSSIYNVYELQRWGVDPVTGNNITYGNGQEFYYDYNANLLYQRVPGGTDVVVASKLDSMHRHYSIADNNIILHKWGFEYVLDLGTIKAIRTSVNIDGAYFNQTTGNYGISARRPTGSGTNDYYPYVGYYPGSDASTRPYNATREERISTSIRLITHIPKVGIVATFKAEFVPYRSTQNISDFDGKNYAYYYEGNDVNNTRHDGDAVYKDRTVVKRMNPIYIVDKEGNKIPFTQEMEKDERYEYLIVKSNSANALYKQTYTPYTVFNIRLTKEIRNFATISFFADNFLYLPGNSTNRITNTFQEMNSKLYFGAEIKFKF